MRARLWPIAIVASVGFARASHAAEISVTGAQAFLVEEGKEPRPVHSAGSDAPIEIAVHGGPTRLDLTIRQRLGVQTAPRPTITCSLDGAEWKRFAISRTPDGSARLDGTPGEGDVSTPVLITLDLPTGDHVLAIRSDGPDAVVVSDITEATADAPTRLSAPPVGPHPRFLAGVSAGYFSRGEGVTADLRLLIYPTRMRPPGLAAGIIVERYRFAGQAQTRSAAFGVYTRAYSVEVIPVAAILSWERDLGRVVAFGNGGLGAGWVYGRYTGSNAYLPLEEGGVNAALPFVRLGAGVRRRTGPGDLTAELSYRSLHLVSNGGAAVDLPLGGPALTFGYAYPF